MLCDLILKVYEDYIKTIYIFYVLLIIFLITPRFDFLKFYLEF